MKEFNIKVNPKDEELEFENEYEVLCFDMDDKLIHTYLIEADDMYGAALAAEDFFNNDYPDIRLWSIRVLDGEIGVEYNI